MDNNGKLSSTAQDFLNQFGNPLINEEATVSNEATEGTGSTNSIDKIDKTKRKKKNEEVISQRLTINLIESQMIKVRLLNINLRDLIPKLIEEYLNEEPQQNKIRKSLNNIRK